MAAVSKILFSSEFMCKIEIIKVDLKMNPPIDPITDPPCPP